jgi:iron complex transport system substrate-binding protein
VTAIPHVASIPATEGPFGGRSTGLAALLSLLLPIVAACGPPRGPARPPGARLVRDGIGREVDAPAAPARIVSLAPSVTATILVLDLGDRLVGVSDFCRLPETLAGVARVGGLLNPSLETIRALHPDLIVGTTTGNDPGLAGQAAAIGVPLYILHTPDVASMLGSIRDVADLLGRREHGEEVVRDLQQRLDAVAARVKGLPAPRVLFVIWADPLVVPGGASFLTDAIARAGGASVTSDAPSANPTFSLESAIARAPDVILMTPDNRAFAERLRSDPVWSKVPALRASRVHVVGEGIVQPGPTVVGGIEEIARLIHPEAFAEKAP